MPTLRPNPRNHSIDTGAKEDRRMQPERRCELGSRLLPPAKKRRASRREMYAPKDMQRASHGSGFRLLERLVSPELYQRESEGIDLNLVVLHDGSEDIGDAGRPTLAL